MNSNRLTKTSMANLRACASAKLVPLESDPAFFLVQLNSGANTVYLHGSDSIMIYPSAVAARRAVRRVRPDLEPTTI